MLNPLFPLLFLKKKKITKLIHCITIFIRASTLPSVSRHASTSEHYLFPSEVVPFYSLLLSSSFFYLFFSHLKLYLSIGWALFLPTCLFSTSRYSPFSLVTADIVILPPTTYLPSLPFPSFSHPFPSLVTAEILTLTRCF